MRKRQDSFMRPLRRAWVARKREYIRADATDTGARRSRTQMSEVLVIGEEIFSPALRARVDGWQEMPLPHGSRLFQQCRWMPRAAPHANIGPGSVFRSAHVAKVKGPSVDATAPTQQMINLSERERQEPKEALVAIAEQQELSRHPGSNVLSVEKRKRCTKSPGSRMFQPCSGRDQMRNRSHA